MDIKSLTADKLIEAAARFFSTVLNPLLAPAYGVFLVLWTSVLCYLPSGTRMAVLTVVFGITCILPMILIGVLHNFRIVKNKRLDDPKERFYPYLFTILCYVGAAFYLNHAHAPMWFVMFLAGCALTCIVSTIVNLRWKISAHMGGMGGLVALLYQIHIQGLGAFNIFHLLCVTIILSGIVGTSRLILRRHSFLQVMAGFINGCICVTIAIKLLG